MKKCTEKALFNKEDTPSTNLWGFLGSKMPILADLPLDLDEYLTFRAKYYIKPPKNHWRLNNGNCLTDISHLGELDMAYY